MSWQHPHQGYPSIASSDLEAHMYQQSYPMHNMYPPQGSGQYFPNPQQLQYSGAEFYPPTVPDFNSYPAYYSTNGATNGHYIPPAVQAPNAAAPYDMNDSIAHTSSYSHHSATRNSGRGGYKNQYRGRKTGSGRGRGGYEGYDQRFNHHPPHHGPYDTNNWEDDYYREGYVSESRKSQTANKVHKHEANQSGNGDHTNCDAAVAVDKIHSVKSRTKHEHKNRDSNGKIHTSDKRFSEEKSENDTNVTSRNSKRSIGKGKSSEEKGSGMELKDRTAQNVNGLKSSYDSKDKGNSARKKMTRDSEKNFNTYDDMYQRSTKSRDNYSSSAPKSRDNYSSSAPKSRDNYSSSAPVTYNNGGYNNYGRERKSVQNKGGSHGKVAGSHGKVASSGHDHENQREFLTEQLSRGKYECMVCCENVKVEAAIWSCQNCYHVFHLHCIKKWVYSSMDKETKSWRCPGCQNISEYVPSQYRCFCGRWKNPSYRRGETPHSCGETCQKKRKGSCKHSCTLLCHPGPCPPCEAMLWQSCDCGQNRKHVRCSAAQSYQCDKVCDKFLNCSVHKCDKVCHTGFCDPCSVSKEQGCFCKKSSRKVVCGTEEFKLEIYSCEKICGRTLSCGNHVCEEMCHPGDCAMCAFMPETLKTCCCGKTPISQLKAIPRVSCLDPMPTCDKQCDKTLTCGSKDLPHRCEKDCHEGECGPCKKMTLLRCECGATEKEMMCEVARTFDADNPYKCQRRCGKKKVCGKHKCSENCCVKDIHICEIVCAKFLSCGMHKCEELCHRGNCKRCMQTSFEELACYCGTAVIEPPVPCGTKPPECRQLCRRHHDCDHPVRHNCHMEDRCPPCTELTDRLCMGGHMLRKNLPCHMDNISCGYPCGKDLPCGQHKCQKPCHKGPCLEEDGVCEQPCIKSRPACGHPCNAPCHTGKCPDTQCKTEMTISCPCGSRCAKVECLLGGDQTAQIMQFQRLSVLSMAESGGQGVDMAQFTQQKQNKRKLDCDTNCAILERNRRMALALEIKNPDLENKLGKSNFSEFLKEFARKNPKFAKDIEQAVYDLVKLAKQSTQASRTHSFPPMNKDQRHFVHELSENYGCQTQSFDFEPNKNVVATAYKEKCWLPNVTLSQALTKDQVPKGPPPISSLKSQGVKFTVMEKGKRPSEPSTSKGAWGWSASKEASLEKAVPISNRGWEQTKSKQSQPKQAPAKRDQPKKDSASAIDYFDFSTN